MQQLSLASRRRLVIVSCIIFVMVLIHVYWSNAFLVYASPTLTAPYALWPRISLSGDSPFTPFLSFGPIIGNLLILILLSQMINWIILPWITAWMFIRLRSDWSKTAWYARSLYLAILLAAIPIIATMWSPFGQTVLTWLAD